LSPGIATVVCAILILGLFWLDRDPAARTSRALWIPVLWLLLAGSRSVSQWLQVGTWLHTQDQYMEGNPLDRLVYTSLLAVGLVVLAYRPNQVARVLRANGPILLFLAYCAVSLLWSDFPGVAFKRWTKALGDLVMVLIVLTDADRPNAIKRFLARPAFLLLPVSVLFIKYYPDLGRAYGRWEGKAFYIGVASDKNMLGVICLFFGLGSAWRFLSAYQERKSASRTRRLLAHGAILTMALWMLWIANSMTSLACFVIATGMLLTTAFRSVKPRPAVVHVLVAALLVVSASVLFLGLSPSALATIGRDPTLTDRTAIWTLIIGMNNNSLLGTGFESFWLGPRLDKIWSVYAWGPTEAHNGYLEIYLSLGWAGVALLAVVLARGYRTVFAAYRRNLPTGTLWLAYFVVGLIYNFTEAAFFRMMQPAWIFLLLAITRVPELPHPKIRPRRPLSVDETHGHEANVVLAPNLMGQPLST
jgi:exopolysaccharide production protein ExoQ